MDAALYRLDRALWLNPLAVCRVVYSHALMLRFLWVVYTVLPIMFCLAYVVENSPARLMVSAIIAAGFAFVGYNLVPAVGPAHSFVGFPWADSQIISPAKFARN